MPGFTTTLRPAPPCGGHDPSLAALQILAAQIRALHRVITAPNGILLCDHCCLNAIRHRRFSCLERHDHRAGPCPTLDILERLGL